MRRLKQIKLTYREKTGTSYKIIWEESSGGKIWEKHLLESSEYPRAELEEAVDDMGRFLIAVCAIRLTDEQMRRNVDVTRVVVDYKSVRQIAISADILLPTGYGIALNGPAMPCQPQGDELDRSFARLEEECFRYIDGDRAQQKLFTEDEEDEEG